MTENNKIDWSKFLPPFPTADTGDKTFKVGEVYQAHIPGGWPNQKGRRVVYRVTSEVETGRVRGHADIEVLAGYAHAYDFVGADSTLAHFSSLVPPALYAELPPFIFNPPPLWKIEVPQWKIEPIRARYLDVVERILVKAAEHKKADRVDTFTQVFVPKDDYEALKAYFDDGGDPMVWTCVGLLSVHPVNPDGATFSD